MEPLIVFLLAAGLFFSGVAALGVLRLPDFYARLHAVSKAYPSAISTNMSSRP